MEVKEVLNKIKDRLITHNIFRIQNEDAIMCKFYCIALIEYMLARKSLLDYTNLFSLNDYKNNGTIIYISILRTNMSSLKFRLKKIDETRNYFLEEIEHDELMSEKHKKTCKCLNHVEHFPILTSTKRSINTGY